MFEAEENLYLLRFFLKFTTLFCLLNFKLKFVLSFVSIIFKIVSVSCLWNSVGERRSRETRKMCYFKDGQQKSLYKQRNKWSLYFQGENFLLVQCKDFGSTRNYCGFCFICNRFISCWYSLHWVLLLGV